MTREGSCVAPWAELVPEAPSPMSFVQFEQWPQDPAWRYELVRGRLVRQRAPKRVHGVIQRRVLFALWFFVAPLGLGAVMDGVGFRLAQPEELRETVLAPDVAFVSAGRGPTSSTVHSRQAWELAPDLVVEIARPDQFRLEMTRKAEAYLLAGIALVWILYPQGKEIDIWQRSEQGYTRRTLQAQHQLDGGKVLSGFTHPVADFFPNLEKLSTT